MALPQRYDAIGHGYADYRRPDPRIAARIWAAVGAARTIVNVGAGAGSYEDPARTMVAVEPSQTMIDQRPVEAAPALRATAEHLPFGDGRFDVAMALMTVHHWGDLGQGLAELRRVARRQVVFTFDPALHDSLWIFSEYVPGIIGMSDTAPLEAVMAGLDTERVEVIPVPADCTDGFITAYWQRPEQYLDPGVRAATSGFSLLPHDQVETGMDALRHDLDSGAWHRRHGDLLEMTEFDLGLRLVIAG
jgi:SAM-dependent methyltransferase